MSIAFQSATQLLQDLQNRRLSSVELLQSCLDQIDRAEPQVGAFLGVDREGALRQAKEVDQRRHAGEKLGSLAGLPVAIKDNLCVKGWKTTCASRMLADFAPPYDAHVIERLRNADAILLGRTNLDEFAMGSSCENSAFQKTRNPWQLAAVPGGSSGGSAAAVSAGMVPLSLGSDTGGSIRQPASFCGIVGVKPTYGRISRYGLIAFASSLDQVGPFARTVPDAALLLETLAGHDPRDSTSVNMPVPSWSQQLDRPLDSLKIGVVPEHFGAGVDDEVAQTVTRAVELYRMLGASVQEISLPHARYGVAAYYIIAPSEASSNLARFDGVHYGHRAAEFENLVDLYETSRAEGFGDEVKRRIMIGAYALSSGYYDAYYLKALKVRRLIANDFQQAFRDVDLVLTPTSPTPAYPLGTQLADPLKMYLDDMYTVPANLAGIPGLSLPCGFSAGGLPIGLQLLAPAFEEDRLFRAAHMYEQATDWHQRHP